MDDVTLDALAAENGLAMMMQGLLAENLQSSPKKRRDFDAMTSTFGIIAPDADASVTLRFSSGHCVIYDGLRDEPDLVITADSGRIPELGLLNIRFGLPWLFDQSGKSVIAALLQREIRIGGLMRLPPTPLRSAKAALDLVRLTRILSINTDP
jgi:hypothetical protein